MATQQERIERAKQIILQHPTLGKDAINKQLRKEFGAGLRRIEVGKLKKRVTAQTPALSHQFFLRQYRTKRLQEEGFLPEEAHFYSQFSISQPGLEKLRTFRKSEIRKARKSGITKQKIERYIRDSYGAHGWVDADNTIRPDFWNKHAFEEILKKPQERETVLIKPENYRYFRRTIQQKFKPDEVLKMSQTVPATEWVERMASYKALRNSFFTHFEALTIITGTAKDVNGKIVLQDLDLNNPIWKDAMEARAKWANDEYLKLRSQGKTPAQSRMAIIKELQQHDGDKRDKTTPYDFLRDYYKYNKKGTTVDYIEGKQRRNIRLKKKKLPYKVR